MSKRIYVGIMSYRQRHAAYPFSEGAYFKSLIRAARSLSMQAFVFCPLDIDWVGRRVYGYTYRAESGTWAARYFPFPHVVYDRLFPPRGQLANLLFAAAKRLKKQRRVIPFGRVLRGKWEVYRSVQNHAELGQHVPETHRLKGSAVLGYMLKKHRYVFIKPDLGSQGKGVMQVRVTPSGFRCRGRDENNRSFEHTTKSLQSIISLISARSNRRRLLVQQGLYLNHFKGSTFDIRCVVQKDENGKWQVTGTAARIGRRGSITSNLHGGGRAMPTERVVKALFPERFEEILDTINKVAVEIPAAMDESLGRFGELGLDLGVDRDGHVWMIEANSKPGRTVFLRIGARHLRRNSILRPMQYCKFLASMREE